MKIIEFQKEQPFFTRSAPPVVHYIFIAFTISYYLLVILFLKNYLPEKWFVDSDRMYSMMGQESLDNSFAMTGRIFGVFPSWSHDILVALVGMLVIIISFRAVRSWRGLILNSVILFPLLLLGLLVPSKETIVFVITLLVMASYKLNYKPLLICTIIGLYVFYGMYIRIYYLLILALWLGMLMASKMPRYISVAIIICGACVFFFLPEEVYSTLQGARDTSYRHSEFIAFSQNRTSFANPFIPDDPFAFIANYAYAFAILHFPFILFISPKEILLFSNILAYAWLVVNAFKRGTARIKILAKLFLAHIIILMLFEPDFGSYFRHFSSIYLYLIPIFALLEKNEKVKYSEIKVKFKALDQINWKK